MGDDESARLLSIHILLRQLWSRFLYYEATTEDDPDGYLEAWKKDMVEQLERNSIMIVTSRGASPGSPGARYVDKVREAYEDDTDSIVRMATEKLEEDRRKNDSEPPSQD